MAVGGDPYRERRRRKSESRREEEREVRRGEAEGRQVPCARPGRGVHGEKVATRRREHLGPCAKLSRGARHGSSQVEWSAAVREGW